MRNLNCDQYLNNQINAHCHDPIDEIFDGCEIKSEWIEKHEYFEVIVTLECGRELVMDFDKVPTSDEEIIECAACLFFDEEG